MALRRSAPGLRAAPGRLRAPPADANALAARLGWLPSYPTFDRNPLEIAEEAEREGTRSPSTSCASCKPNAFASPARTPTRPENFPRLLTVWRSNLLGASSKGHEYFLKHLLGVESNAVDNEEATPEAARASWPGPSRRRRASSTC